MTIFRTKNVMWSDLTPEWAEHRATGWALSWLPGRTLTLREAVAGMRLDEVVSDPDRVGDRLALARATECADELGMLLEQAIILLFKRMTARLPGTAEVGGGRSAAHHSNSQLSIS